MKTNKQIGLFIFILTFTSLFMVGGMQAQSARYIQHLAHQTALVPDGYGHQIQKTATQRSIIYARQGENCVLLLPPGRGGTASPTSQYIRWYDYTTDKKTTGLTPGIGRWDMDAESGFYIRGNTSLEAQQAYYQFTGTPALIACDVSAYTDLYTNETLLEPTLSYRSIFEIRDANEIANKIGSLGSNEYLENYTVTMPRGEVNNRVTLAFDQENYFAKFNVDGAERLWSVKDKETKELRSWTSGRSKYREIGIYMPIFVLSGATTKKAYSNRFCYVNLGAGQVTVKMQIQKTVQQQKWNSRYSRWEDYGVPASPETVANTSKNIAKFDITYVDAPAVYSMDVKSPKSIKYLEKNYVCLAKEDFDTDLIPATAANNARKTTDLGDCSYGFVYPELVNQGYHLKDKNHVPQWNEYGFFKTAEVGGISEGTIESISSSYTWYHNGFEVRDRAFYDNNKTKNGYFMYIDASNMPGTIAKLSLKNAKLCPGTKLIVSAAICDMTKTANARGNVNFIFKGIANDGTETELARYTSGDIPYIEAGQSGEANGKEWYQAYYEFSYTSEIQFKSFIVQVDNNAESTSGGDYAIDDIRVYRSKPEVQSNQLTLNCGEIAPKVKISVGFDKLLESMGLDSNSNESATLQYRFLDSNYQPLDYDYGNNQLYGSVSFNSTYATNPELTEKAESDGLYEVSTAYRQTGISNYLVFITPNGKQLNQLKKYYVEIAEGGGEFSEAPAEDICALISDAFAITPPSYITVDGFPTLDDSGVCYSEPINISAVLKDRITQADINCRFDWYIGSADDFYKKVDKALLHYREAYPNPAEGMVTLQEITGAYTEADKRILADEMKIGNLRLNIEKITLLIQKGDNVMAIPITGTASVDADQIDICNGRAIILETKAPSKSPILDLGVGAETDVVRMSLEQFQGMKIPNKTLVLPVTDYLDSKQEHGKSLALVNNNTTLMLMQTNDANYSGLDGTISHSIAVGELTNITVNPGNSANSITMNIYGEDENSRFTPREGYTYKMMFYFTEEETEEEGNTCNGFAYFYIKIVPKYLTWTGAKGDNWNNDDNWKRSSKAELHKNGEDTYVDYTESKGLVPLDFSKVTIANVTPAPWLYGLTINGGIQSIQNNVNYTTEEAKAQNKATTEIEKDLVVEAASNGNFICRNFTGNTCDEIYFKPQAEMRATHLLTYKKAWVDMELNNDRWYMLSSPLQGVVAGDMYLPSANGRQETEAFADITFDIAKYNRFNPAVYQRSWDNTAINTLPGSGITENLFVSANWSEVYNKVDEVYDPGHGFSIRPICDKTNKVMFRLPKADNAYSYYKYDGTPGGSTNISRTNAGKLTATGADGSVKVTVSNRSDGRFLVGNPYLATIDMKKFFETNTSLEKKYWIMGVNGQTATVFGEDGNMTSINNALATTIAPMQGFFVKKASTRSRAVSSPEIVFSPSMAIAKSTEGSSLLRSAVTRAQGNEEVNGLRLTAKRNGQLSSILIAQKDNADDNFNAREDVESLMDSNLADAPTLYSIAGNQAAIINVVASCKFIPLGIYSNNDEEVELSVNGVESFGHELVLYDAVTNTRTVISDDDETFSIPGNTHGRYFLQLGQTGDGETTAAISIYSVEANRLIVAASPADELVGIQVYNINGQQIKGLAGLNSIEETMELPAGTYLVRAQSKTQTVTSKVMVLNN